MPRLESQAVGGYYALPTDLISPIAALIDTVSVNVSRGRVAVVDPCAADGAALLGLLRCWFGEKLRDHHNDTGPEILAYTVELERERAAALQLATNRRLGWRAEQTALHGDAFRVVWSTKAEWGSTDGATILYLNPPYDLDPTYRRLEHRFLVRYTDILTPGRGVLLLVVPHHALAASAAFLATHYDSAWCFRFPDTHFADYKQVVLIARRAVHPLTAPDLALQRQIEGWARDAECIEALPMVPHPVVALQAGGYAGLTRWQTAPFDLLAVQQSIRCGTLADGSGMQLYGLDGDMDALIGGRPFPVAMPPRPGHIAQALSAGIINGAVLEPDDPRTDLPVLLAKGVFERELRTVEERTNKDGETTGIVQVQQPLLRLCVLDLGAGRYYDLAPGSVPTGTTDVEQMNAADLLDRYRGALAQVMARQCPALHPLGDPAAALPLPPLARTPFRAQREAIYATLKLLAHRENPFVIGEVGTGKSTIALATIAALAADHLAVLRGRLADMGLPTALRPVRRALIVCPPHLLESWCNQIAAVLPGAGVVIVNSTLAVHREAASADPTLPGAGLTLSILSREAAKLGHTFSAGLDPRRRCPRCGGRVAAPDTSLVKERARCTRRIYWPANAVAGWVRDLARLLITALPDDPRVRGTVGARGLLALGSKVANVRRQLPDRAARDAAAEMAWTARSGAGADELAASPLGRVLMALIHAIRDGWADGRSGDQLADDVTILGYLFLATRHQQRDILLADTIADLYALTTTDSSSHGRGRTLRNGLRELLLLLPPSRAIQTQLIEVVRAYNLDKPQWSHETDVWKVLDRAIARLGREGERANTAAVGQVVKQEAERTQELIAWGEPQVQISPAGDLVWNDHAEGVAAAKHALDLLSRYARYEFQGVCDEPLFQAIPRPRRFSIARYITRYARDRFDLLILDEGHEFAGDGSAQEIAAHRLSELGLPTLLLTGSLMNGYASGLFRNLWALSRRFRREFRRDAVRAFVTRYGYRKVLREPKDEGTMGAQSYGAMTDRQELDRLTTTRTLGEAPGVLPVLLLHHLLPIAVTIQKSDLDDALPPCTIEEVPIARDTQCPVDTMLRERADMLFSKVIARIKKDRYTALAGKLFGALGQLPSFYDRATLDMGNAMREDGARGWDVRYPASCGGDLVASADLLEPATLLPKERWLCERLRAELAEGRNVLVFVTHSGEIGVVERLMRRIAEQTGEYPIFLDAGRVPTQKREAWINTRVIGAGKRIMIANPTSIQTGLNNLVWFSTAIWMENPNCNAIVFRQANGRLDRIGQTRAVRILVPVYADTPQSLAQDLLARKVAASEQVDGMDVAASLDAAGAGVRDALDTLEMGRAIYALLTGERP